MSLQGLKLLEGKLYTSKFMLSSYNFVLPTIFLLIYLVKFLLFLYI